MKLPGLTLLTGIILIACTLEGPAQEAILDQYYSGRYNQVIEHTSKAISAGDTTFNVFYLKALSEAQLGAPEKAILTLQAALHLYPGDERVMRMLAGQYYDAGYYVKAWNAYLDLVQNDSTDVSSWLKLADIASFRQQYGQATQALEQVLILDSLNLSSLMKMGEILNRHNNSGAVVYYERAYRHYPDNQNAAYALGNLYIQSKKAWDAVPICEHILDLDSTSIKFRKLLGYAYYKMGEPHLAVPQFEYATSLGDSSTFSFKFKGISHYLTINFKEAVLSLKEAARKDSMDAEVYFFLGASMATTTAKEESMDHLNRSLKLMQPDPVIASRIYSEQGNIQRLESNYEEAYDLYAKALETDSSNLMALYLMASILDNSLHRSEEALVDYQRYIDELDRLPVEEERSGQAVSIRNIVEDRIIALKEELFFLDQQ